MTFKKLGLTAFVAIISALVAVGAYRYFDHQQLQQQSFEDKQEFWRRSFLKVV